MAEALFGIPQGRFNPPMRGFSGSFDPTKYWDQLNLQSYSPSFFTLSTGLVEEWIDQSPSKRNATQTTIASKPLYNNGEILFDGSNDFLNLPYDLTTNTYSLYAVVKNSAINTLKILIGGSTVNNFIDANTLQSFAIDTSNTSGGGSVAFNMGGEEYYSVISIRRNANTPTVKVNGRRLFTNFGPTGSASANHSFGFIGKGSGGFNWNGVIRAVCISSTSLSDDIDNSIIDTLFSWYNLPEVSNALVGFGDSITAGTGASIAANRWLNRLSLLESSRPVKNLGRAGTLLSNVTNSTNNGQDRFSIEAIERPYSDTFCIIYGTNDITNSISSSNYGSSFQSVISKALTAGYSKSNIKIGTVPYQIGDANAATIATYNTVLTNLCTLNGLSAPADVYNQMKVVGDPCMSDSLHPNDVGHQIIADAFAAIIP